MILIAMTHIMNGFSLNELKNPITRVVPKLLLSLSRRTLNATYQNSNKGDVFRSSLSFQQLLANICMSNRSQVTAGFVKSIVRTPLETKRCKKKWTKKSGRNVQCSVVYRSCVGSTSHWPRLRLCKTARRRQRVERSGLLIN